MLARILGVALAMAVFGCVLFLLALAQWGADELVHRAGRGQRRAGGAS